MESYGDGFPHPSALGKLLWVSQFTTTFAFMANCNGSFGYVKCYKNEGWDCWVRSFVWLIFW